ncbi:ABC transporter substrate-binding protein [Halocynthiibacter sp. C4]|uniref:ABC transporter substrate-binding protein n=1 Tax=Halocynthiibacter sp. C4 TaxID=2992758 RepID=UPI00237A57FF|nr:ABC transporter substrate-binding protein [Halocynthiibacter sp. C4]MDE0589689.1 ABC transporter substrate-binding protein [Halocynthiibacter sp. C4]
MGILNKSRITRRSFLRSTGASGVALASGLSLPAIAQNRKVTIVANQSSDESFTNFKKITENFTADTGIEVVINRMDHEGHKTAIRNYLVAGPPDVTFWFSGARMRGFVERGLFDDITDFFEAQGYADVLGGTTSAVTVDGRQYGLPMGGTLWGNFYLQDVMDEHGLTAPSTWDEMFDYGKKARGAGLTPQVIGTKELWPAAGLFDALNLRINGLDRHMALMAGEMSYLDPALTPVFDQWRELIEADYFLKDHTSFGWQEAGALLGQGKGGMMHLGNFIRFAIPEEKHDQIRFAPFPKIADIARYEDFSVNSVHVPSKAENKDLAREFLAYFYEPENLAAYLYPEGNIPPRSDVPPADDPLINAALESLKSVEGTAQYYDRDTPPDMAQAGLKGFQQFMAQPERRDDILSELDRVRGRVFNL